VVHLDSPRLAAKPRNAEVTLTGYEPRLCDDPPNDRRPPGMLALIPAYLYGDFPFKPNTSSAHPYNFLRADK